METFKQCSERLESEYPGIRIRHMWKWFAKLWWSDGVTFGRLGLVKPNKFEARQCIIAVHEAEHAQCWVMGGWRWLFTYAFKKSFRWREECYAYARQALYEYNDGRAYHTLQGLSFIHGGFVDNWQYFCKGYDRHETAEQIHKFALYMSAERG